MARTNVTTCPDCNQSARRTRLRWWQRLLWSDQAHYLCRHCQKGFYQIG